MRISAYRSHRLRPTVGNVCGKIERFPSYLAGEKFSQGLIHLDRDHRHTTLLAKVIKEDDAAWMETYLDDLRQVISLFLGSPLHRRHVHATAAQLDEVAKPGQRMIDLLN